MSEIALKEPVSARTQQQTSQDCRFKVQTPKGLPQAAATSRLNVRNHHILQGHYLFRFEQTET